MNVVWQDRSWPLLYSIAQVQGKILFDNLVSWWSKIVCMTLLQCHHWVPMICWTDIYIYLFELIQIHILCVPDVNCPLLLCWNTEHLSSLFLFGMVRSRLTNNPALWDESAVGVVEKLLWLSKYSHLNTSNISRSLDREEHVSWELIIIIIIITFLINAVKRQQIDKTGSLMFN